MNATQKAFSSITGFESSYKARGAEMEGWEDWSLSDLCDVITYGECFEGDVDCNLLFKKLQEFKNENSGEGVNLDIIFNSINKD